MLNFSILSLNLLAATPTAVANSDANPLSLLALICPLGMFSSFYLIILCLQVFVVAISCLGLILWIWMLVDLIQRDAKDFPPGSGTDPKVLWILVVLLTSYIGAVVYYFMVYRKSPPKSSKLITK